MFSELEIASFAATAVITLVPLLIALALGKKWDDENKSLKLGFKWGYFFILFTLLGNGLLLFVGGVLALYEGEFSVALFFAGTAALLVISAANALQRRRWALVLTTLLSFNVLWIFINLFYLRNRWSELAAERAERLEAAGHTVNNVWGAGMTIAVEQGIKKLSKSWRLAIFGGVAWVLAVAVFVFLFEPYGSYMRDDDMMHMLSVMFMPTSLALGLYWIYDRLIR
jgi:hypothetical protein